METNTIDLIPEGITKIFHASQGDIGRVIRCNINNGADSFVLTGTESLNLRYMKLDGSFDSIGIDNTFASKTYVDITIPEDMTEDVGRIYCKLHIDGIGAKAFYLDIEGRP